MSVFQHQKCNVWWHGDAFCQALTCAGWRCHRVYMHIKGMESNSAFRKSGGAPVWTEEKECGNACPIRIIFLPCLHLFALENMPQFTQCQLAQLSALTEGCWADCIEHCWTGMCWILYNGWDRSGSKQNKIARVSRATILPLHKSHTQFRDE